MRIADTHAHYDEEAFDADRDELLRHCLPEGGVCLVVNMGASMEGAENSAALAQKYGYIYAGCGIHPDEVGVFEENPGAWDRLQDLLQQPKVVCVGEIGLDYHWMVRPKEIQKKWFRRQMQLASELHMPVNIHSREAAQDTFDLIRAQFMAEGGTERILSTSAGTAVRVMENAACLPGSGTGPAAGAHSGGIIHCYSGSVEMAREYVKMGWHIGIGGVVTFKSAKTLKKVTADIPLERIVTETDCPYMAPEPHRGTRNDSRNIRYVIETIAALQGIDADACGKVLWKNACEVYRISEI